MKTRQLGNQGLHLGDPPPLGKKDPVRGHGARWCARCRPRRRGDPPGSGGSRGPRLSPGRLGARGGALPPNLPGLGRLDGEQVKVNGFQDAGDLGGVAGLALHVQREHAYDDGPTTFRRPARNSPQLSLFDHL